MDNDPMVDRVDEPMSIDLPIPARLDIHFIPGSSFEACLSRGQGNEQKLPFDRSEVSIQMGGIHFIIEGELLHGPWLFGHIKGEPVRFIPDSDRFDKCAGGKFTISCCPDPLSW